MPMTVAQTRSCTPIRSHPAHDLGIGKVSGFSPDFPNAAIGVLPVPQGGLDRKHDNRPRPFCQRISGFRVLVDAVNHGAENVELMLLVGGIAHPDRTTSLVAGEMLQSEFVDGSQPVNGVENPQMFLGRRRDGVLRCVPLAALLGLENVTEKPDNIVRLGLEAKSVESPHGKGGISNPGVAIVPVAVPTDMLGERGRRCRKDCSGGCVGKGLEGQNAPLEMLSTRVVGISSKIDPIPPEAIRSGEEVPRLSQISRGQVASTS